MQTQFDIKDKKANMIWRHIGKVWGYAYGKLGFNLVLAFDWKTPGLSICHQEDSGYLMKAANGAITLMLLPPTKIWPSALKPQEIWFCQ